MAAMTVGQFIKQNNFEYPMFLIYGSAGFLAERAKNAILKALGCDMMNLDVLDADATADDVISRAEQLPCFAEHRLIIINNFSLFAGKDKDGEDGEKQSSRKKSKSDAQKAAADGFAEYLKQLPATTKLLFICEKEPDKRRTLYKYIMQNAAIISAEAYKANELVTWGVQYAKSIGLDMKPQTVRLLIDMSGSDMQTLANETEKLRMLGKKTVTDADIKKYASADTDYLVFDLHTFMIDRQYEKAFALTRKIFAAERTFIPIIAFLEKRFDIMNMARGCLMRGMGDEQTVKLVTATAKEKEGSVWHSVRECKGFKPEQLRKAIRLLADYEYALKSGGPDPGIESVLIKAYERD